MRKYNTFQSGASGAEHQNSLVLLIDRSQTDEITGPLTFPSSAASHTRADPEPHVL